MKTYIRNVTNDIPGSTHNSIRRAVEYCKKLNDDEWIIITRIGKILDRNGIFITRIPKKDVPEYIREGERREERGERNLKK